MQEKHLFEYAIIRVMPLVERQEFINVGVILYCSSKRFLQTVYTLILKDFKHFQIKLILAKYMKDLKPLTTFV